MSNDFELVEWREYNGTSNGKLHTYFTKFGSLRANWAESWDLPKRSAPAMKQFCIVRKENNNSIRYDYVIWVFTSLIISPRKDKEMITKKIRVWDESKTVHLNLSFFLSLFIFLLLSFTRWPNQAEPSQDTSLKTRAQKYTFYAKILVIPKKWTFKFIIVLC